MRQILHIDMDAFFASVEQRDQPELRGKPVLVGGRGRRSVVCAASYEARVFGARSAMPMGEALRRCPTAIVVPVRRERYAEASERVFDIFRKFTPLVEGLSLDEAFLDVTESRALFGDGETIARAIRAKIWEDTQLTGSAGVAASKFVAKIASDVNKPDGITVVPDDVAAFLAPLPIRRMWGVGPKSEPRFVALGLRTFGDLQRADEDWLGRTLGEEGPALRRLALGEDDRPVIPDAPAKSIGAESTYEQDLHTKEQVAVCMLDHCQRVGGRLLENAIAANVVVLKLKMSNFVVRTRRLTLDEPVFDTTSLYEACKKLLAAWPLPELSVRLVGVSAGGLEPAGAKPRLFPNAVIERRSALERAMREASQKTGAVLTRAALLEPK
ncbi:MAG: DNA polymerase IV [Polyangiaceae bacterium]|nr:DNA polymerase IV [Polyangiaceae bacterium]